MKPVPGANTAAANPPVRSVKEDPHFGVPSPALTGSDFTLGELASGGADPRDKAVAGLFRNLIEGLAAGKNVENLLHPDYRPLLQRTLAGLPLGPVHIQDLRIGRPLYASGAASSAQARILVFAERGRALGELAAELHEGKWLLSLIVIDAEDLFLPHEKIEPGVFDPVTVLPGL
jgi:hypothetical protein